MADRKRIALIGGPVLAASAGFAARAASLAGPACWTAATTVLCAAWWIFEPIPIPATSLLPFGLLPLAGVLSHTQAAAAYGDSLVLLFMGGFMLSAGMEKSGAHRRLALLMIRAVGGHGGRRLVLGFMLASAALSMWITNTATVLMLLPIAASVLSRVEDDRVAAALLLAVAYGASIGGIGTPVGTPPNGVFISIYRENTGRAVGFLRWMAVAMPVVVLLLPLSWLWLTRRLRGTGRVTLPEPGPWRAEERRMLVIFGLTAALWVGRAGWSRLLGVEATVGESTVALLMAATLFLVPDGRDGRLLDWETAVRIPWGVLILFGGGIALAKAFGVSGLTLVLGNLLGTLTAMHTLAMILVICLVVTFLTEVTSNTATATVLMPVLAAAGLGAGLDPALLMIPAAISCSCAFMLPVGTPPNAIVFGTGRVTVRTMAREGLAINFIGAAVIAAVCWVLLRH